MKGHSAHVDADVLAELSAGLINGKRATRIHAHLAGCQRCAQRSAALTELTTLLAAVPPPVMPDAVARRLNATLAREAADRSAPTAAPGRPGEPDSADNVVRFQPTAKGRRRGLTSPAAARAFAAAAAACVVAAGGYTAVQLTSGGPATANGPSTPKHGGGSLAIGPSSTGGAHAQPFIPKTNNGAAGEGPEQLSFKVVDSGIDYQSASLASQVRTELNKVAALKLARSAQAKFLHTPTAQQYACVSDVTGGTNPALVDSARFQNHPATIIALAHVGNQLSQAWVVGPSCSASDTDILKYVSLPTSGG
jgi:hypothetical protein